MTLFQCRRFQFYDLEKLDVDITVKENLKGSQVICGSSGQGRVVFGDSDGYLHFISRQLESRRVAEAHNHGIIQIYQMKQSSSLILTLGTDESYTNSIKIWEEVTISLVDSKTQLFLKKTLKLTHHKPPSVFAPHENTNLLAVGYSDGTLQLFRGDFRRDKNIRPKTLLLEGEHGEITGLVWKVYGNTVVLFVSAKNGVFSFDLSSKDREIKLQTDKLGCEIGCSCFSDGSSEEHFMVGRNDGVYCYTHEGRGPCYGFEGEKLILYSFRGNLLIVSRIMKDTYNIIVFDVANKYVGFSSTLSTLHPIRVAAGEWGSIFLILGDGTLWQLKEKDLQSKMGVFYKKNHYDLAIKIAKAHNFDGDSMAEVFRKYGDHLYAKGDLDGAIRQYCKTVGKLEASYVVRKYLDASRVLNLLEYLEVIHKMRLATPDLTTLLLNCLTKLKLTEKIEHYVKDPQCDFLEPETAIKVFRRGGMSKQAYQLAQKHNLYGSALQILLEDVRDPCKDDLYNILEKTIHDENAESILKRYGHALVQLVGQQDPKSNEGCKRIVRLLCESPVKRDLVELFIAKKDILVPLLENISLEFEDHDGPLMNLLLEAYLEQWSFTEQHQHQSDVTKEKLLALLSKAPECVSWDWARALFACKKFGFSEGEIIAYEKLGLHNDLLAIRYAAAQVQSSLWTNFIDTCRKYAKNKPTLWKDAFYLITSIPTTEPEKLPTTVSDCPQYIVEEILSKLLEESLMEPLPILDKLCQTTLKLGSVRSFLVKVLDRKEMEDDEREASKLQEEIGSIRNHIQILRTKPSVFQGSRCNACMQKLDFPSVHFLCLHSFHQSCFESYTEDEKDCPLCLSKNKAILGDELTSNKPTRAALDADFALKLSTARSNSFSVLADFFSKGVFKEEPPELSSPQKKPPIEKVRGYASGTGSLEPVSEGRLRLNEGGISKFGNAELPQSQPIESLFEAMKQSTNSVPIVPLTFDARHSVVAPNLNTQNSTSLPFPRVAKNAPPPLEVAVPRRQGQQTSTVIQPQQNITSKSIPNKMTISAAAKNPFEEDEDIDPNNPFAEPPSGAGGGSSGQPKNPFEDEDDYDPSLNPFES